MLFGIGQSVKFVSEAFPDWNAPISFDFTIPAEDPGRVYYNVPAKENAPFGVFAIPEPLDCDIAGCPPDALAWCGAVRSCAATAPFNVYLCFNPEKPAAMQVARES